MVKMNMVDKEPVYFHQSSLMLATILFGGNCISIFVGLIIFSYGLDFWRFDLPINEGDDFKLWMLFYACYYCLIHKLFEPLFLLVAYTTKNKKFELFFNPLQYFGKILLFACALIFYPGKCGIWTPYLDMVISAFVFFYYLLELGEGTKESQLMWWRNLIHYLQWVQVFLIVVHAVWGFTIPNSSWPNGLIAADMIYAASVLHNFIISENLNI